MTNATKIKMIFTLICMLILLLASCSSPQNKVPQTNDSQSQTQQNKSQTTSQTSATTETTKFGEIKEMLALYLDEYTAKQVEKCTMLLAKLESTKYELLGDLLDYMENISAVDKVLIQAGNWNVKKIQEGVYSISGIGLGLELDQLINGEFIYYERDDKFVPKGIPSQNLFSTLTCPE